MENFESLLQNATDVLAIRRLAEDKRYGVYHDSIFEVSGAVFFLARTESKKVLVVKGKADILSRFEGELLSWDAGVKVCPQNNDNCLVLAEFLPFMNPVSVRNRAMSMGLGDRLRTSNAAHAHLLKRYKDVTPVLAQNTMRELDLMSYSYVDVLCAARWAVFQEGFTSGFGADGDHLKRPVDVQYALDCGFTMITLDCSEQIGNKVYGMSEAEAESAYLELPADYRDRMERKYLDAKVTFHDYSEMTIGRKAYMQTILIYHKAVEFAARIYFDVIVPCGRDIDFEVSLDETIHRTLPEAQYIVASELLDAGVVIASLAPKFVGKFNKSTDFIGDVTTFEQDYQSHERVARLLGYRLSVHSGSDKFSIFPAIGRQSDRFHLKTAGTNWIESLKVVAICEPDLFRKMYKYAYEHLDDVISRYPRFEMNMENVCDIDRMANVELVQTFNANNTTTRLFLHLAYYSILRGKDENGNYLFCEDVFRILYRNEELYYNLMSKHIGEHLTALGIFPVR
jgi:hypothetical protein